MNIVSSGGIKASRAGGRIIISGVRRAGIVARSSNPHPLADMGFFASVNGSGVTIAPGALRVTLSGANPYGVFAEVNAGGDGVMDPIYVSGFTPDTDGYLVFKYARLFISGVGGGNSSGVSPGGIDFGDPGGTYYFGERTAVDTNDHNGYVESPAGVFDQNFAVVFEEEPPPPSEGEFRRIICRVTVGAGGVPSVHQVHIGDILVPLAHSPRISDIYSGYDD